MQGTMPGSSFTSIASPPTRKGTFSLAKSTTATLLQVRVQRHGGRSVENFENWTNPASQIRNPKSQIGPSVNASSNLNLGVPVNSLNSGVFGKIQSDISGTSGLSANVAGLSPQRHKDTKKTGV